MKKIILLALLVLGVMGTMQAQDEEPVIQNTFKQIALTASVSNYNCDSENWCTVDIAFESNSYGAISCKDIPVNDMTDNGSVGDLMGVDCGLQEEDGIYFMDCKYNTNYRFEIITDLMVGKFPVWDEQHIELLRWDNQVCNNITRISGIIK